MKSVLFLIGSFALLAGCSSSPVDNVGSSNSAWENNGTGRRHPASEPCEIAADCSANKDVAACTPDVGDGLQGTECTDVCRHAVGLAHGYCAPNDNIQNQPGDDACGAGLACSPGDHCGGGCGYVGWACSCTEDGVYGNCVRVHNLC